MFGERARHGLDMMESFSYMSLPDEFFNILDEFMVSLFDRELGLKVLKVYMFFLGRYFENVHELTRG